MYRPPYKRPQVMARLKRLYDAWARGHFLEAQGVLAQLPKDVRAVIALCQYLGKLGDLNARRYHRKLYRANNIHVGRAYNLSDLTDEEHNAVFGCPKPEVPPEILQDRPYSVIKSIDWESGTIEFTLSADSDISSAQPAAPCDENLEQPLSVAPRIVDASCALTLRLEDLTRFNNHPESYDQDSQAASFFPFAIEGEY